jgi:predicted extracellular nuclease
MKKLICAMAMALCLANSASAAVRISEWMYSGGDQGEFIEFTNYGPGSVDFTGWSFDDDSRLADTVDLSGFGTVAAGESVLLIEVAAVDFRAAWSLPASVKIVEFNTTNLSRNDEINLYDASDVLVDRFAYGDQNIVGSIRTQNISGNPGTAAELGANNALGWVFSSTSDSFGSYESQFFDVGNPGIAPHYTGVPEPSSIMLVGLSALALMARRR